MIINVFQIEDIKDKIRQKRKIRLYNKLVSNRYIIPLFSINEFDFGNYSKTYKWKCLKCNSVIISKINYNWYSRHNHISYCRCTKCFPIDRHGTALRLKKYGNKMGNIKKLQNTKLKIYGNKVGNIEKLKQTKAKFSNIKLNTIQNKRRNTCIQKYGVDSFSKTKQFKQKLVKNSIAKYGCESPNQVRDIQLKKKKKYTYNNISFDSKPELALYIYCIDKNIDFEYQPIVKFTYLYKNKLHYYQPDFRIKNRYYEIKGDHLIDKNGNWICPFNKKYNRQYKRKQQCAIIHNVIILTAVKYKKYLDYIDIVYGKKYLEQYKNI